ncbi:hypothetical protein [Jannaschia seohaensis]|uniref:Uncharacterized protein n=1 Tax=Jannaschia seohaensis TaxID=475081 RepID=A0A2Y9C3C4_9RHOB|nr:hypothetical protein [Jannaschia seohaensis]PWJ12119.1 hypothetical protein BCF38_11753 [Jannaschia seohaensis]SSA51222.1 hypothetical protein SAMN05421539_11753 [Jannaschia seohaensis]
MLTHEAPISVAEAFFGSIDSPKTRRPSRTSLALEKMLALHRPRSWAFGHWHERRDWPVDGTRFIALEEGGWVDLPDQKMPPSMARPR